MPCPDRARAAATAAAAAAAFLLGACGSLTSYRTAEPIPRGHWQLDVATDVGMFADRELDTRTPAAHVELAVRRGLRHDTDATLKLYVPGVELAVQHRVAAGRWQWAVAAAAGLDRTRQAAGETDALFGHLRLNILATRRTSARWAFTLGPVVTGSVFVPAGGGHATGLLVGGFASAARTFARCWQVIPELSVHVSAAGEVPVRGTVVQLGAAVGRRF
ncbi:MAG TPA: hypothetical protein VHE35_30635 [Kofleriaceae bacterium]|nr:hypothetical protein [Kofleriaceae bacterium]